MRILQIMTVFAVIAFINACAGLPARPEIPEKLDGDGMVVGQLANLNEVGLMFGEYGTPFTEIKIDNRVEKGAFYRGYFAFTRKPGEYSLDSVFSSSSGSGGSFGGVTVTTTRTTTLPINKKFRVRAGEVTNLGLMFFVKDPAQDGRYRIISIDNTREMQSYIAHHYPGLAGTARKSMQLSPEAYLDRQRVQALKTAIAARIPPVTDEAGSYWVAGDAGTVALIEYNGKTRRVKKLLPSPVSSTIQAMVSDNRGQTLAFSTMDDRFFALDNDKIVERQLPEKMTSAPLFMTREFTLITYNSASGTLFTSQNMGKSWQPFVVDPGKDVTEIFFLAAANGYYIYTSYENPLLFFSPYGKVRFQSIALPEEAESISSVFQNSEQLFLTRNVTFWTQESRGYLFVRDLKGGPWETRRLPHAICGQVYFSDNVLAANCYANTRFVSSNFGKSWRPVAN